jgi:hypothetical protein
VGFIRSFFNNYQIRAMQALDDRYYERLQQIAAAIQDSPTLAQYMEEEEDELYNELRQQFEPYLSELHHLVAAEAPLQMVALETYMLNPLFESLYLPRVLGYAVLRGEINDQYKYVRPNDHFKAVLLAICNSPQFEQLKKRIGQTITVGFALSSDIWITNLMSAVDNKRVRFFLQQQKTDRYRDARDRKDLYSRYSNQLRNEMYHAADFPSSLEEMKPNFSALRQFLLKRFEIGAQNESLRTQIKDFLNNKSFQNNPEYLEMLAMFGNFMDLSEEERKEFAVHFNRERKNFPEFDVRYLGFLLQLYQSKLGINNVHDERMTQVVDKKVNDKISDYYRIADKIHNLGYVHQDAIEAVQDFYAAHEGLSVESNCLRQLILQYFVRLINGFNIGDYSDYFELNKIFGLYMRIFDNQEFNQEVEKVSMAYIKRLLKHYTDKRSRDYQDVKKFVATQFVDFGFLSEKEVVEMFKTRRKRKKTA